MKQIAKGINDHTKQDVLNWIKSGMSFKTITVKSKKVKGLYVDLSWECSEGLGGDYDFQDPTDMPLLRFDVGVKDGSQWVELQDASFCTQLTCLDDRKLLEKAAACVLKEAENSCEWKDEKFNYSWKRIMEGLSWMEIKKGKLV
jgi:hypothetical protein